MNPWEIMIRGDCHLWSFTFYYVVAFNLVENNYSVVVLWPISAWLRLSSDQTRGKVRSKARWKGSKQMRYSMKVFRRVSVHPHSPPSQFFNVNFNEKPMTEARVQARLRYCSLFRECLLYPLSQKV
jgi:hypothetical protein